MEWVTGKLREQETLNAELVTELRRQNTAQDETIALRQALIRHEEQKAEQALYLETFQTQAHIRVQEMEAHYAMVEAHQRRVNEEQMLQWRAELAHHREIQEAQAPETPFPQPRPPQPQVPETPCTTDWTFAGVSIATPPELRTIGSDDEDDMSET